MKKLLTFITELEKATIYYSIEHNRDDAIMVLATVPGERWEIEFFANGNVEVEIFKSSGEIKGESELKRLLKDFCD